LYSAKGSFPPILWTHHEKWTCCDEVKQQQTCAFFFIMGTRKKGAIKKLNLAIKSSNHKSHPPLPSMPCTPEQTKGNKPVQKSWCVQSSR
jgi:hypothetical protein